MYNDIERAKQIASDWYHSLRDDICGQFESIEQEHGNGAKFHRKSWNRDGGGGGEMSLMRGEIFEKVGVNVSIVFGEFMDQFSKEIPGTENSKKFWASGVSIVAHMNSPFIPAIHANTRFIVTEKAWFGGGTDLTPTFYDEEEKNFFHSEIKSFCDKYDSSYYPKFSQDCDNYFFLRHRNEPRGVGGIFYDYFNNQNWEHDFNFNQEVGLSVPKIFSQIVAKKINHPWDENNKREQLIKRGRYVEFNLLYDRGTKFGLMTNGNTEAILMSLPPIATW